MKYHKWYSLMLGAALLLMASLPVSGQNTSWAGKYEGTGKGPNGEVQFTLEITDEAGKISGRITSQYGVYKIISGKVVDGVLTIEAEGSNSKGKMTLRWKDGKLVGELTADGTTGAVEFKKVSAEDISGVWNGVADAQGQPFPFTLTLKVDGEKVTGSSSSQLGDSPLAGTWKDGKLAFVIE